jgi:hypothetical protein
VPATRKSRKNLGAKNLPKNDFQKSSKVADFQQENHPGQNPEFSASPLCPIFTRLCRVLDNAEGDSGRPSISFFSQQLPVINDLKRSA